MDKTVLITGGSRGIGAATVKKFTENGYKAAFFYKNSDESAKKTENETGATAIKCDVGNEVQVKRAVDDAKICLGGMPDTVVLNAGISLTGLFTDMTFSDWRNISQVNLDGAIFVTKEIIPDMIYRKSGQIIIVSSMWGQIGASCEVGYSTTKAAVIGLAKSLAKEVGPSGIRVNCVSPGLIDTDMNREFSEEALREFTNEIPLGRMGEPRDVANAIFFLASKEASYITGQVIGVNGGYVI